MERQYKGESASPGIVKGRVKVIYNSNDLRKIKPGDIIVAYYVPPSYFPVLLKAKGVITEQSGILAHGAILARELGIPAVTGVKNVMRELKDDIEVIINGNEGIVISISERDHLED